MAASRGTVLIVEDDPYLRATIDGLLRIDGFDVVAAANGLEALHRLRTERISVIVLDLAMPIMDGETFLDLKARDPSLAIIPTVVVSGREGAERVGESSSVVSVLRKPVEFEHLVRVLRAAA